MRKKRKQRLLEEEIEKQKLEELARKAEEDAKLHNVLLRKISGLFSWIFSTIGNIFS